MAPRSGSRFEVDARDDLYEQCSDHMTEYIASSRWLGSRPRIVDDPSSSSSVSPSARWIGSAVAILSRTAAVRRPVTVDAGDGRRAVATRWMHANDATRLERPNCAWCTLTAWPREETWTASHPCPMSTRPRSPAGRNEGRVVKNYLEALETNTPEAGPQAHRRIRSRSACPRSTPSLADADPLAAPAARPGAHGPPERARGHGRQGRPLGPRGRLRQGGQAATASRKGITYAAWREVGCRAAVLEGGRHQPRDVASAPV